MSYIIPDPLSIKNFKGFPGGPTLGGPTQREKNFGLTTYLNHIISQMKARAIWQRQ
tara:strand:+ start:336 stop:503 length:168 start_codon:yes stop_codon:yes gene_type:complete